MELFVFVCAAAMVMGGALGVITRSNPVHAALSLVLTLFGIAVLFIAQEATFLAAVQVIVYAGAIVVLFLFVIMLLGVDRTENIKIEPFPVQRVLAGIIGVGIVALVGAAIIDTRDAIRPTGGTLAPATVEDPDSNIRQLATDLFQNHVFAFELTSVLLVIAVVGTVLLARRPKADSANSSQKAPAEVGQELRS